MTWVRIDDQAPWDRALIGLSDGALGVWLRCICYASQHLTDGHLPAASRPLLGPPRLLRELVDGGRLHRAGHDCPDCPDPDPGGWQIHGYLEWQRSRSQVEGERRRARARAEKSRLSRGGGDAARAGPVQRTTPARAPHVQRTCAEVTEPEVEVEKNTPPSPPHGSAEPRPDRGGGDDSSATPDDRLDAAATALADMEIARRGGEIGNPEGYRRARTARLRRDHEATWRAHLAADPNATRDDLVAIITRETRATNAPQTRAHSTTLDDIAAAQRRRLDRDSAPACDRCDGTGWVTANPADRTVAPCPWCRQTRHAAGDAS